MVLNKSLLSSAKPILNSADFAHANLSTPAFVYDRVTIQKNARLLRNLADRTGIKFTYSVKACALDEVIKTIMSYVSGFSVSSLFEAQLCRAIIGQKIRDYSIHITNPAFKNQYLSKIAN